MWLVRDEVLTARSYPSESEMKRDIQNGDTSIVLFKDADEAKTFIRAAYPSYTIEGLALRATVVMEDTVFRDRAEFEFGIPDKKLTTISNRLQLKADRAEEKGLVGRANILSQMSVDIVKHLAHTSLPAVDGIAVRENPPTE